MLSKRSFTIFCRIIGAACVVIGALVLTAQIAEWWSYGDWNAVSVRYVLNYFNILPARLISGGYRLLDFPVSVLLLGTGALIAVLGGAVFTTRRQRNG